MKERVMLDYDECCVELVDPLIKHFNKKYGTNYTRKHMIRYGFQELWPITREQAIKDTFEFYETKEFQNLKTVEGAAEAVGLLAVEKELIVVSGRPYDLQDITKKDAEKRFNGNIAEVYCAGTWQNHPGQKKKDICPQLGIKKGVEDCLEDAVEMALGGMTVHLLDKEWNKEQNNLHLFARNKITRMPDDIYRHLTWLGIVNYLLR